MSGLDLAPTFETVTQTVGSWLGRTPADVLIVFWTIFCAIVCNTACAILGCFLVLRRMSLLGDAISHSILPGIVVGFLLSGTTGFLPMFGGALVAGLLCTFLTQTLHEHGNVAEDSSMGVVFTSLFALGVILISRLGRLHLDADCVLYGKIELVSLDTFPLFGIEVPRALASLAPVLALTIVFVIAFWKELKISSFDPMLATAMGLSATAIHYLLMTMVAAATVSAFESVGSIVVIAMLIVPGATAHLLTDRLVWMIFWAILVGIVSAVFGFLWASYASTSASGMMAVVAGLQFLCAVLLAPRHGLVSKAVNNFRLSLRIVSEDLIAMLYRLEERQEEAEQPFAASWSQCVQYAGGGLMARLAVPILLLGDRLTFRPGGKLTLTESGRNLGESLVRSHRLWEAFLEEHFELPADHLHEPASRIEHYIGPALQERLARELQSPDIDPHGRAIPPSQSDRT